MQGIAGVGAYTRVSTGPQSLISKLIEHSKGASGKWRDIGIELFEPEDTHCIEEIEREFRGRNVNRAYQKMLETWVQKYPGGDKYEELTSAIYTVGLRRLAKEMRERPPGLLQQGSRAGITKGRPLPPIPQLCRDLKGVAGSGKLHVIGLELIDMANLEIIEEDHPNDVEEQLKCILVKWQDTTPNANLEQIVEVLSKDYIQLRTIASDIDKKYRNVSPLVFTEQTPETVPYTAYQQLQAQCQQLVQQLKDERQQRQTESEVRRQKEQQIRTLEQENRELQQRLNSSEIEKQRMSGEVAGLKRQLETLKQQQQVSSSHQEQSNSDQKRKKTEPQGSVGSCRTVPSGSILDQYSDIADQEVTAKAFSRCRYLIAEYWKDIGYELDMENKVLGTISVNNHGNVESCAASLYTVWSQRTDHKCGKLMEAVQEVFSRVPDRSAGDLEKFCNKLRSGLQ